LTTVDRSDIRGLVTARLGFVAELLSLQFGSSTLRSYPTGAPRILLTVVALLKLFWIKALALIGSLQPVLRVALLFLRIPYTLTGPWTSLAIAHINAQSSLAMAVTTNWWGLPFVVNRL